MIKMSDQKPQQPQPRPLTEQQLKQRRLQRVLARASNDPHTEPQQPEALKQMSGFEMFKASRKYQGILAKLEIIGIVVGVISGVVHLLGYFIPSILLFLFIGISVGTDELVYYRKSLNFAAANSPNDPFLTLISRFKQVNLVTNILHFIQSIRPLINYLASTFLTVVLVKNAYQFFNNLET